MQILRALLFFTSFVLDRALCEETAVLPFKHQCLKWHNTYRKLHQVSNVTWNNTLAEGAESWANHLAQNNLFEHAKHIKAGENLYISGSPVPEEPCAAATKLFYGEVKNYDYKKPGFSMDTGHFTQVVRKNTKEIGAAKKIRRDGKLVVVIRYFPPGNLMSEKAFKENVLPESKGGQMRSSLAFTGLIVATGAALKFLF